MNDFETFRLNKRRDEAAEASRNEPQPFDEQHASSLLNGQSNNHDSNAAPDTKIVLGDSMPEDRNMPILQESQVLSELDLTAIDLNLAPRSAVQADKSSNKDQTAHHPIQTNQSNHEEGSMTAMSKIEPGLSFEGNAVIAGSLTLAGQLTGNVHCTRTDTSDACSVVITETGYLTGDITAQFIAVMGQSNGLLNASGGKVELHQNSSIAGHVRYKHLMVNGALLNATLECVNNA